MYLNSKTKKKIPAKTVLFFSAIIVVVLVFITGIIMLLTKGKDIKDTIKQLPFTAADSYFAVGGNVVYANGNLLTCVDASQKEVWKVQLDTSGLKYTSNGSLIAAYGESVVFVMGAGGENLFAASLDGVINSVRLGSDKAAVCTQQVLTDKTLSYIFVFDQSGNNIYQLDISGKNILDYGFDYNSQQLYILELDVTGAAPLSRITSYRPDTASMTGIKELRNQLVSRVYFSGDAVYTLGTTSLSRYSDLNSDAKDMLVYGWVPEDICGDVPPSFVYVPSDNNGFYTIARVISSSGDETKINLPPDVFKIFHEGEKIYCFATNYVFVYTGSGGYLRTYDTPFAIDGASRAMDGYVFLKSGENMYLLPLP